MGSKAEKRMVGILQKLGICIVEIDNKINELDGQIKVIEGVSGVWFDGPPEAPENGLFIPFSDLIEINL